MFLWEFEMLDVLSGSCFRCTGQAEVEELGGGICIACQLGGTGGSGTV